MARTVEWYIKNNPKTPFRLYNKDDEYLGVVKCTLNGVPEDILSRTIAWVEMSDEKICVGDKEYQAVIVHTKT